METYSKSRLNQKPRAFQPSAFLFLLGCNDWQVPTIATYGYRYTKSTRLNPCVGVVSFPPAIVSELASRDELTRLHLIVEIADVVVRNRVDIGWAGQCEQARSARCG